MLSKVFLIGIILSFSTLYHYTHLACNVFAEKSDSFRRVHAGAQLEWLAHVNPVVRPMIGDRAEFRLTSCCRGLISLCAFLWLQDVTMGVHITVEASDRIQTIGIQFHG